ncbi:MAG: hypothetical protein H6677_15035 [Candidatus Obscuribacterales bacterium]|nr:hypothetical protein [Cyanobacteria bacterium HKST-UBA01]MCB9469579.1 hypothetical protein [Candidatus Obscuribacterales bacterium]
MKRFILRLVLLATAIDYILPMLDGISFHGNFIQAIGAGLFFSLLVWLVEWLAITVSALLAISTFGLAILFLIPVWLVGFWLLPAVCLKLLAGLIPHFLTINGWLPAIWGGLVMLVIGIVTGERPAKYKRLDE